MKKRDLFLLIWLTGISIMLILFSADMREGAYNGLILAQNTIIPSLLPLLIIFLLIMKTGAKDALARLFGNISVYVFNLPEVTLPAIFFGLTGGYPTGALLTEELLQKGEIDCEQARRLLCFNVCGGCGFIVTAIGGAVLKSEKAGLILFASNVISNILTGIALSFRVKRISPGFYSFSENTNISDALFSSVKSAVGSVLNITAFIMLFSAVNNIINPPEFLLPAAEITTGLCTAGKFSLPEMSAYLAFGGMCIHMQLLPVILKAKMKYRDFLLSRIIGALLSYCITKLILLIFPIETEVFSSSSEHVAVFSSVNPSLSFLMIFGCFVIVLDLVSRKKKC